MRFSIILCIFPSSFAESKTNFRTVKSFPNGIADPEESFLRWQMGRHRGKLTCRRKTPSTTIAQENMFLYVKGDRTTMMFYFQSIRIQYIPMSKQERLDYTRLPFQKFPIPGGISPVKS